MKEQFNRGELGSWTISVFGYLFSVGRIIASQNMNFNLLLIFVLLSSDEPHYNVVSGAQRQLAQTYVEVRSQIDGYKRLAHKTTKKKFVILKLWIRLVTIFT